MAPRKPSRRVSEGLHGGGAGVNHSCHGWTGIVPARKRHVMASPRVYAIYWDAYFQKHPWALRRMDRFFQVILRGRFMWGLRQYGVRPGRFVGSTVVVPDPRHRLPRRLTQGVIDAQLKSWLRAGTVTVAPRPNETDLLYVIFTPAATSLGPGLCGYHQHGRYRKSSGRANLFWAAIQQWNCQTPLPRTPRALADACTWCISHEMVEAFTDRDNLGYRTGGGCEIGDICECAAGCPKINKIKINDTWLVEPYWSNAHQRCYPYRAMSDANGATNRDALRGDTGGASMGNNGGMGGRVKRLEGRVKKIEGRIKKLAGNNGGAGGRSRRRVKARKRRS